jgi:hypothetical protein
MMTSASTHFLMTSAQYVMKSALFLMTSAQYVMRATHFLMTSAQYVMRAIHLNFPIALYCTPLMMYIINVFTCTLLYNAVQTAMYR